MTRCDSGGGGHSGISERGERFDVWVWTNGDGRLVTMCGVATLGRSVVSGKVFGDLRFFRLTDCRESLMVRRLGLTVWGAETKVGSGVYLQVSQKIRDTNSTRRDGEGLDWWGFRTVPGQTLRVGK